MKLYLGLLPWILVILVIALFFIAQGIGESFGNGIVERLAQ